jgi:3-oxoacyl-[acyl-carrier protein] reductase
VTQLSNRVALVTAGSRGLGAEIVRQLARAGADAAFTYLRDEAAASALVDEVETLGRQARGYQADAAEFERAVTVVEEVATDLGGLHLLVCNAGVAVDATLLETTEQQWDSVLEATLKSAFNYIRAAGAHFAKQADGRIVCIGSINGLRGRIGTLSYNVAKAGLAGLVKSAAAELGPAGVNVNLVAPGFIETPSQHDTPALIRDLVVKETALKRLGTPADIAPLVVFLCSDDARHLTGQLIKVDAGQYL